MTLFVPILIVVDTDDAQIAQEICDLTMARAIRTEAVHLSRPSRKGGTGLQPIRPGEIATVQAPEDPYAAQ